MESPPSYSAHSDAPQLSDDSGLLITSGSFSSDSASGWPHISPELQESDYDERSLSLCEPADTSELMCGVHFNTVKKGPGKVAITAIEPPPEFQDNPPIIKQKTNDEFTLLESEDLSPEIILKVETATTEEPISENPASPIYTKKIKYEPPYERRACVNERFASARLVHLSPCGVSRPASRGSLSSRRSSSHNSLATPQSGDDSSFITQAISHHTLSAPAVRILDFYNVPFDSDIYALPIDMLHPTHSRHKAKKPQKNHRKRGKNVFQAVYNSNIPPERNCKIAKDSKSTSEAQGASSKRHSLPGCSSADAEEPAACGAEPMHMTLRQVRNYLHTLYSSSSESDTRNNCTASCSEHIIHTANKDVANRVTENGDATKTIESNNNHRKTKKSNFVSNIKSKKHKENKRETIEDTKIKKQEAKQSKCKSSPVKMLSLNLKQTFCNLFRLKRAAPAERVGGEGEAAPASPPPRRALPPLPPSPHPLRKLHDEEAITHFATSIQKVKDYGWYWGPISVEGAEKILSNEPDGSFIVRDSSDHHYIFTLTFKLNGLRHVRIEHEQGNFCFGGCAMFKAATIVEFIENAVETSRSGRYLFFLNLRPVLGPVRVQLLYPVSRFKRVQSLQHMCRFVILKVVRRDLVGGLPLPRRLLDYLSATQYFSELLADS